MSCPVWVRPLDKTSPAEGRLFLEWLFAAREKNRFDPELFKRGQAVVYTLWDATGVVGFVPVTVAYVLESLAFRPGLGPVTEAKALEALQHLLVCKAAEGNVPDAYFVTLDETVLNFARRYGWRDVVVPMLNLHFADLAPREKKDEDHG